MSYKILFYKYYILLKENNPSYLGIEDAVSSCIVGTLFYLKFIIVYLVVSKCIFEFVFFNETIFYFLFLFTLIYFYFVLVKINGKEIKRKYKSSKDLESFKWTIIALFYPIVVIAIFVITIMLILA